MEIRFRVWDGEKMHYPETTEQTFGIGMAGTLIQMDISSYLGNEYSVKVDKESIAMLSTGLKDKSGKEIWEGDIITTDAMIAKNHPGILVCVGTSFVSVRRGSDIVEGGSAVHYYTAIGNQYENPELIKEVA